MSTIYEKIKIRFLSFYKIVKTYYFIAEDNFFTFLIEPPITYIFQFPAFTRFLDNWVFPPILKIFNFFLIILKIFRIIPDWSLEKQHKRKSIEYKALLEEDFFKPFFILKPFKIWPVWAYFTSIALEVLFRLLYSFEDVWFKWFDYPIYLFIVKIYRFISNIFFRNPIFFLEFVVFLWNRERQVFFNTFWYTECKRDIDKEIGKYLPIYLFFRFNYCFGLLKLFLDNCELKLYYLNRLFYFKINNFKHYFNYYFLKNYDSYYDLNFKINSYLFYLKYLYPNIMLGILYFKFMYVLEDIVEFIYFKFLYYFSPRAIAQSLDKLFKVNIYYRIVLSVKLFYAIFYPNFLFTKSFFRLVVLIVARLGFIYLLGLFILNFYQSRVIHKYQTVTIRWEYDLDFGKYELTMKSDFIDFTIIQRLDYLFDSSMLDLSTLWFHPIDFLALLPFLILVILVFPLTAYLWRNFFDGPAFVAGTDNAIAKQIAEIVDINYEEICKIIQDQRIRTAKNIEPVSDSNLIALHDSAGDDIWNEIFDGDIPVFNESLASTVSNSAHRLDNLYHSWYNYDGIWSPTEVENVYLAYCENDTNLMTYNTDDTESAYLEDEEFYGPESEVTEEQLETLEFFVEQMTPIMREEFLRPSINIKQGAEPINYSLEGLLDYRSPIESDYTANLDSSNYPMVEYKYREITIPTLERSAHGILRHEDIYFYEIDSKTALDLEDADNEDKESEESRKRPNIFTPSDEVETELEDFEGEYNLMHGLEELEDNYKNFPLNSLWTMEERKLDKFKFDAIDIRNFWNLYPSTLSLLHNRNDFFNLDVLESIFYEEDDHQESLYFDYLKQLRSPHLPLGTLVNEPIFDLFDSLISDDISLPSQETSGVSQHNSETIDKRLILHSEVTDFIMPFGLCMIFFCAVFADLEYNASWIHPGFTVYHISSMGVVHFKKSLGMPITFIFWLFFNIFIMLATSFLFTGQQTYIFFYKAYFEKFKNAWFPKSFTDLRPGSKTYKKIYFWPPDSFFINSLRFKSIEIFRPLRYVDFHLNFEPSLFLAYGLQQTEKKDRNADTAVFSFDEFCEPFTNSIEDIYTEAITAPIIDFTYEHIFDAFSPENTGVRAVGYPFNIFEHLLWLGYKSGPANLKRRLVFQLDWTLWYRWRSYYALSSAGRSVPRYTTPTTEYDFYIKLNNKKFINRLHNLVPDHYAYNFDPYSSLVPAPSKSTLLEHKDELIALKNAKLNLRTALMKKYPDRKKFYFDLKKNKK